jgi:hypothetical protein
MLSKERIALRHTSMPGISLAVRPPKGLPPTIIGSCVGGRKGRIGCPEGKGGSSTHVSEALFDRYDQSCEDAHATRDRHLEVPVLERRHVVEYLSDKDAKAHGGVYKEGVAEELVGAPRGHKIAAHDDE